MKFDALIDFLQNKMSMAHIYQPLLIKSLVDAGGSSTIRQLASNFLAQDESQIRYYEKRIKEMPLRILKKHEVVEKDGELVTLSVKKLSIEQKAQIKMICEKKLQEFIVKRGLGIWDYRLLDSSPVPDSLYYNVLKDSNGRRVRLMKGCEDGNEKSAGGMEQYLPWLQHWAQISRFLYRQESEESLGKRLHLA